MDQERQPITEPKSPNSILKIVIWITAVLILMVAGYFVYNRFFANNYIKGYSQDEIDFCQTLEKASVEYDQSFDMRECLETAEKARESAALKIKDVVIKSGISELRPEAENYWNSNGQTYIGFDKSAKANEIVASIQSNGSQAVFQNITSNSYLVYAKLVAGSGFFCVDSTGLASTVQQITEDAKTCPVN